MVYIHYVDILNIHYIVYIVYNGQSEDNFKNTICVTRPGFEPRTYPCGTRKYSFCARLRLPLAAPSRGYFFFLRLLHESIEYWAYEIAAVHIVHVIISHDWVGISRVNSHALAVSYMYSHHADRLFKPIEPRHGFPKRRTRTDYCVYNSQL